MGESENRWTKLGTSSDDRCSNCHVRHWCESCNKPQTGKYRRCLRSGKRVLQTVSKKVREIYGEEVHQEVMELIDADLEWQEEC